MHLDLHLSERKQVLLLLVVFGVLLSGVAIFSASVLLGDVGDYLSVGKEVAGLLASKVRSTHSWAYGVFLAPFLSLFPSLTTAKLANSFWLIADAALLYLLTRKKTTLLLWIFSPVVWMMSIWISPLLPTSFFLLLSYYFLRQYEERGNAICFFFSAAILGITTFIWDGSLFITPFFLLAFFYSKQFKAFFWYFAVFGLFASLRFAFDYYLFHFPLATLFRVFGGAFLTLSHQGNYSSLSYSRFDYLLYFVVLSPLLLLLVKLNFKKYGREFFFFICSFLLYLLNAQPRYTLAVAPFGILLLSTFFEKREVILHCFLSFFVILFLVTPYFIPGTYDLLAQDMKEIAKDYPSQRFLVGGPANSDLYAELGMLYWGKDIGELVSYQDYNLWTQNKTDFQYFKYRSSSRYHNQREIWFAFGLSRADNKTYEDLPYLIDTHADTSLSTFKPIKHYRVLWVFQRISEPGI
ncbi:hypothetical protein HZB00_00910 [Candidatus Woesearchaeota archaeon]|nr:hypothetical protein [Candidatus Woesearchaeota archaeon]